MFFKNGIRLICLLTIVAFAPNVGTSSMDDCHPLQCIAAGCEEGHYCKEWDSCGWDGKSPCSTCVWERLCKDEDCDSGKPVVMGALWTCHPRPPK
jgi:hypothetical protein